MKYTLLVLAAAILTLASCRGGRSKTDGTMSRYIASTQAAGRVVELISSVSPTLQDSLFQGDTVFFSYLPDTVALDSAVLSIRGERQGVIEGRRAYAIGGDHPVGRVPYRVAAYRGGDSTVRVGEFLVRPKTAPRLYGYKVIASYPHDSQAYTQGLFYHEGFLYETTGLEGRSTLRKVDLVTGDTLQVRKIDDLYFGEGAVMLNDTIYMLTWQHNKGFVFDAKTFEPLAEFGYAGEGWGLTTDSTLLYMSNGTEKIQVLDPATLQVIRTFGVYTDAGRVTLLNELEWIEGEIWANVYQSDRVVRIDPATGAVTGEIDLRRLLPSADKDLTTDVLNGIAYDPATKRIWVTGKNWKRLFEIEVISND